MEDPFQSLLEDATPRTVLREQLGALKPVDTPAAIRRAGAGKRKSGRIEKKSLKRMKDGDDANLQTPVLGHQSQQSQQFSTSDLGVSLNVSNIKGVNRTYADLSALDSDESSVNESIDLDLEAAARFRKKKRSVEYLTQPEVSVSKIAKKPPKAAAAKKTIQKSKKPSSSSNVLADRDVEVNLSADKTYANLNTTVMESSSDSIDLGVAKNIRHPKKQGIVFPEIDSVFPTPESPQVDRSLNSSKRTYGLRSKSKSDPKWKSPQMFQSVREDSARKRKTSFSNQNNTLTKDQIPQLDNTYESVVDNEDSFENVQVKTKQRFTRKAPALKLDLSTLIKGLRAENRSFTALEDSRSGSEATSEEREANENEIASESLVAEDEIIVDTQSTPVTVTKESIAGDKTTSEGQASTVREEDNLPERPSAEVKGILISREQKSWSGAPAKTYDEVDVLSVVHGDVDSSKYELNDTILPPVSFRDVNEVDDESHKILSTSFSSDSGGNVELDDNVSAAVLSLESDGENTSVLDSSKGSDNVQSSQPPSYTQDRPRSVEKDATSLSVRESPRSARKGTALSPLRRSPRKQNAGDYRLTSPRKDFRKNIGGQRTSLPLRLSPRKNVSGKNSSLSIGENARKGAGVETTFPPSRMSSRKTVDREMSSSLLLSARKVIEDSASLRMSLRKLDGKERTSILRMSPHTSVDENSPAPKGEEESHLSQYSPSTPGNTKEPVEEGLAHGIGITPSHSLTIESSKVHLQDSIVEDHMVISNQSKSTSPVDFEDTAVSSPVETISEKIFGMTRLVLTKEEVEVHPEESIRAMQRASRNLQSNIDIVRMAPLVDAVSSVKSLNIDHQQVSGMQETRTQTDSDDQSDDLSLILPEEQEDSVGTALATVDNEMPANISGTEIFDSGLSKSHVEHTTDDEVIDNPQREGLSGEDGERILGEAEDDLHVAKESPLKEGEDGSHVAIEDPMSDGEDVTYAAQKDPIIEDLDDVNIAENDPVSDNEDVPVTHEGPMSYDKAGHVHENLVNEGEDVAHPTQKDLISGEDDAHIAQADPVSEDEEINLLPVSERKAVQLLQDKPAEDSILTERKTTAYPVTIGDFEDNEPEPDTSNEETPLLVHSQEEQSGGNDLTNKSATDTSAKKLESQPGLSKAKQMTMRDFLQKLASKPVPPPALDKGRPRPWLDNLLRGKQTSLAKKTTRKAASAKTKQMGKKPLPLSLPKRIVKEIFTHYAKCKVTTDGLNEIMKTSEKYWKNLSFDLLNFVNARKGSKEILDKDMMRIMSRQGLISSDQSLSALVEEHLPVEDWNVLIPTAFAKDVTYPSHPAGGGAF